MDTNNPLVVYATETNCFYSLNPYSNSVEVREGTPVFWELVTGNTMPVRTNELDSDGLPIYKNPRRSRRLRRRTKLALDRYIDTITIVETRHEALKTIKEARNG